MSTSNFASITQMMLRKDHKTLGLNLTKACNANQLPDTIFRCILNKTLIENQIISDFHLIHSQNNLYEYLESNTYLLLQYEPKTAEEIFSLACSLRTKASPMVLTMQNKQLIPADEITVKQLQFSLLNDAAKAGVDNAYEVLVHYVTAHNESEARKYLVLHRYNLFGFKILLPREFSSAEDYKKLGAALIIHKDIIKGEKLKGSFFELEDGAYAHQLGRLLIGEARKMSNHANNLKLADTSRSKAKFTGLSGQTNNALPFSARNVCVY
jgi:hypothetical protein